MSAQKDDDVDFVVAEFDFLLDQITEQKMKCSGRQTIETTLKMICWTAATLKKMGALYHELEEKADRASFALTVLLLEYVAESK